MLVELSVMEQRYQAVMAVVQDGVKGGGGGPAPGGLPPKRPRWIARYEEGGLAALADRSDSALAVTVGHRPWLKDHDRDRAP